MLHVAGWADKAFRYLADTVDPPPEPQPTFAEELDIACTFRGRRLRLLELPAELRLEYAGRTVYRWRKGQNWATLDAIWLDVR